ncbi:hypothetical protein [Haliangium sp.]|uniref:hypothetical protein n=1 Tax=Haliangium sp. TaxID=2663208 RepID=UPI003D0A857B
MLADTRFLQTACLVFVAAALPACSDTGAIELQLAFPDDELAPLLGEVAEVSLLYWESGEATSRITRPVTDHNASLVIDEFPAGQALRMAVELRSGTQRLIGFGRTPDEIEIEAGVARVVTIEIRRPFVYLGGASGVDAIDTSRDASAAPGSVLRSIDLSTPAQVAVPTYNGKQLVVITARHEDPLDDTSALISDLRLVATGNHQPLSVPVDLFAPASDVAVSADGRYAVVAHDGATGGVSVVDLFAARDGREEITFLPLGSVGRVSAGAEDPARVFALVDRIDGLDCTSPTSKVVEISLANGASIVQEIELGAPAQDLAAADDGAFLVVADSCTPSPNSGVPGTLWRVPIGPGEVSSFDAPIIRNVSAVALWNKRMWAVTSEIAPADPSQQGNAQIRVLALDLEGDTQTVIDLPPFALEVETPVFSDTGQVAALEVDADGIYAFDLAVVPGAGGIALLFEGTYFSQPSRLDGNLIVSAMDIRTVEYMLVDVATTTPVQHVITRCDIVQLDPGALIVDWGCARGDDVSITEGNASEPLGISVLYGSR